MQKVHIFQTLCSAVQNLHYLFSLNVQELVAEGNSQRYTETAMDLLLHG